MIFQHTWQKVLDGTKTQTRRLRKPGQYWATNSDDTYIHTAVLRDKFTDNRAIVYAVGKTYAVQPGRGKCAVARIKLLEIRRVDVRKMTSADVIAEGFSSQDEFIRTWAAMHDKSLDQTNLYFYLNNRPLARYDAWALTFELVTP